MKKPSTKGMLSEIKEDLIAMVGEFIGTVLFLLFGLGAVQVVSTNVAANSSTTTSATNSGGGSAVTLVADFYIAFSFGISLFATASIFYRFTGSIFNPSVSLALCIVGAVKPLRFILVALAQMVGGIVAAAIVDGLTPGELTVNTTLGQGTSRTQGLFIEMFCTSALVLSVLMLAAEKSKFTPMAPLGFGLMLTAVMLFATPFTGGAINTARAFGPACLSSFTSYHWIYWLGPTLGSLLATGFYTILKMVHYWEITPDQDSTEASDAPMQEVV